jgi:nitrate reductase NapE component
LGTSFIWRALPALVAAAIITFSRDHSAAVGFSVFGGFAIVTSIVILVGINRIPLVGRDRTLFGIHAVVTLVSGILALVNAENGLSALVPVLSIWAALTAALELYAGYRQADRAIAREWLTIGAFTAILALAITLFPVNDIYAVGLFGAYGAILGVYLIIAGLSLRSDEAVTAVTTSKNPIAQEQESQS